MSSSENRDKLIRIASRLFRRKGYDGVGLKEILVAAELPKGSLYYHFPGGKVELADAATRWAGDWVARMLGQCFDVATSFEEGGVKACEALAAAAEHNNSVPACPVVSILQAAPSEPALRKTAEEIYDTWTAGLVGQAKRFGIADPQQAALSLHMRLQGAWILAYAQQSAAPFHHLAAELRQTLPD
ncbi:TetR/AcrR family transcriptional regulator [Phaeobacter inhibens]|uniref:TetR/AcrR family transcriptional regulator n=1 Tax=Phaeobacter inhibens TaxID=221822 RepID=UPI0021A2F101|nr:TetR/AcrR family transcriptional regulator [Phaeobacter inhibens]UWR98106.1 TetR/AcrR family transcriptional regulator [Phaeobacter inhibens]